EVIFELKDPEEVYRKVQEKLKEPIDAFFISGDERAMGAYKAVYEAGLKIPENVAILGIDNLPFSEYLHPPLTTIDQRVKEFAGITVKILLDAMRHWDPKVKRVVIPPRLIERGSV
ncbi:MAG: LacI family transcriptional regulator, partial [Thermotoga sp.]